MMALGAEAYCDCLTCLLDFGFKPFDSRNYDLYKLTPIYVKFKLQWMCFRSDKGILGFAVF
jgi:hypothetical protein